MAAQDAGRAGVGAPPAHPAFAQILGRFRRARRSHAMPAERIALAAQRRATATSTRTCAVDAAPRLARLVALVAVALSSSLPASAQARTAGGARCRS